MNFRSLLLSAGLCWAVTLPAAVPPAEQLLPADTLLMLSVPNWSQAQTAFVESPPGRLWRDPAMKAFREKFEQRWSKEFVQPLERQLGIQFSQYTDLLRGQITWALTRNDWKGGDDPAPAWLLLIDTVDCGEQLAKNLAELRQKWTDARKTIKTVKIRDVEMITLVFTDNDLLRTLQGAIAGGKSGASEPAETSGGKTIEITLGQSGSLFLAGNQPKELEKILARQSGGMLRPLAEHTEFQARQAFFRDTLAFGWLDLQSIAGVLRAKFIQLDQENAASNPMGVRPDKVFSAVGVEGLKSLCANVSRTPDGHGVGLLVSVPEAQRKGLVKMLTAETKTAEPPPFVPAEAVRFNRWRLNLPQAWNTFEAMLAEISPQLSGLLQLALGAAGKDKDPNFDLRKSLIANLGDDLIAYEKIPTSHTFAALDNAPSLFLVGSPNADQLIQTLRTSTSLLIPPSSPVQEREFKGRTIYRVPIPQSDDDEEEGDEASPAQLCLTANGGYLAVSTEEKVIEEFLRSGEDKPKTLAENLALKEAAQKIGGMNSGLFGYENQNASLRAVVEMLRKDPAAAAKLFAPPSMAEQVSGDQTPDLSAWFDFSLLPPFDQIAKYFHFSVYTGSATPEGLLFRTFLPTPPGLKTSQ